jgi:Protein of unknown function (DUF616)
MFHIDYLAYKVHRKAKFVIYTAISGNFDNLIQHAYVSKDADYICYTDQVITDPGIWEIRSLETQHLDRVRSAKYYKLFPHELFPEAQYSVWIDGNIDVLTSRLELRVMELMASDALISANIHFERDCAYEEALVCNRLQLDDLDVISNALKHLEKEGFPRHYGLFEMNIIFRQHHRMENVQLMQSWWEMITKFSRRDQISFTSVLHRLKITCEKLFPTSPRFGSDFTYKAHNKKMCSLLYVDTGDGFQPDQVVDAECFVSPDTSFALVFNTSSYSGIKQFRFDPVEGMFCNLKITKLIVTSFNGDVKVCRFEDIKNGGMSNGIMRDDGVIEFETFDPQLELPFTGDIKRLVVSGQITFVQLAATIGNLLQRIERLLLDHASLHVQQADVAHQLVLTASASQMLNHELEIVKHANHHLEAMHADLQTRIQALLDSRTWRVGKVLLWLPKALFKRV